MTDNLQEIMKIIQNQLKALLDIEEEVKYNQELSSIGLNSRNSIQLIVTLEEVFDVILDDKSLHNDNFSTIEKIALLFVEKM